MQDRRLTKKILELLLVLRKKAEQSEGKRAILEGFPRKVNQVSGIETVIHKLNVMYDYFRAPDVSRAKKAWVSAALLYFLLPVDLIVDWLPGGYVDDEMAVLLVWNFLAKDLEEFEKKRRML
jgi:uncharacterized membrane protein YkvA (DUF1232 family)